MSTEPITLDEAKTHLRVDSAEDNALISRLITTARLFVEKWTHRKLMTTVMEKIYDVPSDSFSLPYPPLQEVVKIEVIDDAGVKTEVSSSIYDIDLSVDTPGRVKLKSGCVWPDHRDFASFIVTFKAGYGEAAADVPEILKQALFVLIGHLYENRGDEGTVKARVQAFDEAKILLAPYKVYYI